MEFFLDKSPSTKVCFGRKNENFGGLLPHPIASPSTRNMSYDLRCEPKIPKRHLIFGNSSIEGLIRPKCLQNIR